MCAGREVKYCAANTQTPTDAACAFWLHATDAVTNNVHAFFFRQGRQKTYSEDSASGFRFRDDSVPRAFFPSFFLSIFTALSLHAILVKHNSFGL